MLGGSDPEEALLVHTWASRTVDIFNVVRKGQQRCYCYYTRVLNPTVNIATVVIGTFVWWLHFVIAKLPVSSTFFSG